MNGAPEIRRDGAGLAPAVQGTGDKALPNGFNSAGPNSVFRLIKMENGLELRITVTFPENCSEKQKLSRLRGLKEDKLKVMGQLARDLGLGKVPGKAEKGTIDSINFKQGPKGRLLEAEKHFSKGKVTSINEEYFNNKVALHAGDDAKRTKFENKRKEFENIQKSWRNLRRGKAREGQNVAEPVEEGALKPKRKKAEKGERLSGEQKNYLEGEGKEKWQDRVEKGALQRILGTYEYVDEDNRTIKKDWFDEKGIQHYFRLLQKHVDDKGDTRKKFLVDNQFNRVLEQPKDKKRNKIFQQEVLPIIKANKDARLVFPLLARPADFDMDAKVYKELPKNERSGHHWILCDIDLQKNEIKFYNSMPDTKFGNMYDPHIKRSFEEIKKLLITNASSEEEKKAYEKLKLTINENSKDVIPEQINAGDCGAYVCKFAEAIALGKPIDKNARDFKPDNMVSDLEIEKEPGKYNREFNVREQMAARIMNNSLGV